MTNVLIVEDSRISREAIEHQLTASGEYTIIASIENAANAEIACMKENIDLILMDVCSADDESGLDAAAKIKKHYPDIRIIIMTSMPEHSFMQKARNCGCDGFWYKEFGNIDLLEICRQTMAGKYPWPEKSPVIPIGCTVSSELTDRELEVIRALALGMKYEEIARDLGITTNTVKYHIKNLMQKTGYRNTLQLVADVVEKRLILPKY